MFYNKGIDIPYQELPLTGQFNVLPLDGFQSELARLPHRHSHYQIIWFMKAKGKHIVDFVTYELEDNVMFLLQPGQVHQLLDCNKQGHFITFTEKFYFTNKHDKETLYDFTCLFDSWQGYSPIRISDNAAKSFQSLIELMSREMACSGCSRGVVKHYLNAFLLLLEREKKRNATQIMMPLSLIKKWPSRSQCL